MSFTPGQVTARSEHTGLANAGEMGSESLPCARAVGVQFFYDDPWKTPITNLEIRLADASGAIMLNGVRTEAPASRGMQDVAPGTGALRPQLGGVRYGSVPFAAGALTATTNPSQNIPAVVEQAWQIEQEIVAALEAFENSMKRKFKPYVDDWNQNGVASIVGNYSDGVLEGMAAWWESEKDFWGTAWGALKRSVSGIAGYVEKANEEGLPIWVPSAPAYNLISKIGRDLGQGIKDIFQDKEVIDFLDAMGDLMRGFLTGDIDKIRASVDRLKGLKELAGAIGEFGSMLVDAFKDGVDWLRDMVEVLRRTPVLGLMANTAMQCLLLMTPNFWASALGEGVGFVIPELLIWVISSIIAALSAGAGAAILAQRCLRIASSIRKGIKGSAHVAKLLSFLDEIKPIFDKIGELAKKLRESIEEVGEQVLDKWRVIREARYWRRRLADIARQGHGPQRHEGDVTDKQLYDRVYLGHDPMTNSVWDGVLKDSNGKPKLHKTGQHATKFNTPADYVRAYDAALKDPRYITFAKGNKNKIAFQIEMKDVFGPNFQTRIKGYTATLGTAGKLPVVNRTVFPNDTFIVAVFTRDANGKPALLTMYPNFK